MERCDFSSVIGVIRRYISDDYNLNQTEKASEAKVRFIEKLKIRTRTDLESTTSKRISKFNLFRIQI